MTTLAQYMHWLRSIGGNCKSGIGADEKIGMVPVVRLVAPDGKHVTHGGGNQYEILSTITIRYFDRRLGVESPFYQKPFKVVPKDTSPTSGT